MIKKFSKWVKSDRNMSFCEIRITEDDLPSMFKREGYIDIFPLNSQNPLNPFKLYKSL